MNNNRRTFRAWWRRNELVIAWYTASGALLAGVAVNLILAIR